MSLSASPLVPRPIREVTELVVEKVEKILDIADEANMGGEQHFANPAGEVVKALKGLLVRNKPEFEEGQPTVEKHEPQRRIAAGFLYQAPTLLEALDHQPLEAESKKGFMRAVTELRELLSEAGLAAKALVEPGIAQQEKEKLEALPPDERVKVEPTTHPSLLTASMLIDQHRFMLKAGH